MPSLYYGYWATKDLSPFVVKLLSYLEVSKADYNVVTTWDKGSVQNTKAKGKFPFVKLPSGDFMGDSQLIIETWSPSHTLSPLWGLWVP